MLPLARTAALQARLRIPVVVLVLAFTAVPFEMRPAALDTVLSAFVVEPANLDVPDMLANIAGYVVVGLLLGGRHPFRMLAFAGLLSLSSEVAQVVSVGRSPSVVDLACNVFGAGIGLAIAARWWRRPVALPLDRRASRVAAGLAAGYVALAACSGGPGIANAIGDALSGRTWMATSPRGATLVGRLEGRWLFDQSTMNVTPDSSGNGRDGTLIHGATLIAEGDGRSLRLDGYDQHVYLGNPVALRMIGSMSIGAWIKPSAFPVDDAAIVSSHNGLGYQLDTTVDQGPRTIGFKLADSSGRLTARYGRTPLAIGTWYHVAGVYDAQGRTLHVYLNGQRDDGCLVGEVSASQKVSGENVYIGRRADSTAFEFVGLIDDVRMYSLALTGRQVREDMYDSTNAASRLRLSIGADRLVRRPNGVDGHGTACKSFDSSVDRTALGVIVTLGLLVAIAMAGYSPSAGALIPAAASLLTGLLLLFVLVTPSSHRWMVPLLSLAGGVSLAASMHLDRQVDPYSDPYNIGARRRSSGPT